MVLDFITTMIINFSSVFSNSPGRCNILIFFLFFFATGISCHGQPRTTIVWASQALPLHLHIPLSHLSHPSHRHHRVPIMCCPAAISQSLLVRKEQKTHVCELSFPSVSLFTLLLFLSQILSRSHGACAQAHRRCGHRSQLSVGWR